MAPLGRYPVYPCRSMNFSNKTDATHMDGNTIVLPEGALVSSNAMDQMSLSMMRDFFPNLAALPWKMLYQLQDGIIAELRARQSHAIQVLSEQKIKIE